MADTFTNDLRVRLQEVGANSGTWGNLLSTTITNIAESWSYGTEALANSATQTLTLADGTSDELRSFYVKLTGTLSQATTVTIAPNTISKSWIIENATTGGYAVTISQGSGANVAIANGNVKMIATDGAGAGAVVYDLFTDLSVGGNLLIDGATPTLTIGDAGAEDTKIVFDGNAQDFYIGLDDSTDDLVFGKGSALGTTQAMAIDENLNIAFGPFGGGGNAVVSGSSSPSFTNQAGTNLLLKSGDGSGTGSSFMSFYTSPAGSSGTTVNTSVERMVIDSAGKIQIGNNLPMWSGAYGGGLFLKGNNASSDRYAQLAIVDSTGAIAQQGVVVRNDGNVGVGSAGMACYSAYTQFSVGTMGHIMATTAEGTTGSLNISQNAHFETDGTWETMVTDEASNYYQYGGGHYFRGAGSTTAGTDITWATNFVIGSNGHAHLGSNDAAIPDNLFRVTGDPASNWSIWLKNTQTSGSTWGQYIQYGGTAPDDNVSQFFHCGDTVSARFIVYSDGDAWTADAGVLSSDRTLKTAIQDATPKLADVMRLKVRNFEWDETFRPAKKGKKHIGFIAQEFEEVFPALVTEHDIAPGNPKEEGYEPNMKKALKEAKLIPILVKAIQEQQTLIETLQTKVKALEEA